MPCCDLQFSNTLSGVGAEENGGDGAAGDNAQKSVRKAGGVFKAGGGANSNENFNDDAAAVTRAEAEAAKLIVAVRESLSAVCSARAARTACARTSKECQKSAERAVEAMQKLVVLLQTQCDENRADVSAAMARKAPMVEVNLLTSAGCTAETKLQEAKKEAETAAKRLEQLFTVGSGGGGA